MSLTPSEYAWEQLCHERRRQHQLVQSRPSELLRMGRVTALARVVAQIPGTFATYEADKAIIAADRANRRLNVEVRP